MKYGRFTALVLALNLVFDGVAFAGHNNDIEINSDRNFTNNETITSDPKSRSKPSRYSSENDVLIEKSVKYTDFFCFQ